MLNRLNNILLIFILFVSIIFTQQIMDISAQDLVESEEMTRIVSDPYLLDDDFTVEKFVVGLDLPVTMEFMGNDLLVVQKNDGKVRLIRDNILQNEPVLDVEVSNYGEIGLLGITSKDSTVYLFFQEAFHDGGLMLESRIYSYTWNGQKLVEPRLVKTLPGWPQGGGAHYSGVFTTDLSKNVYFVIGNQYKYGILQNYLPSESFNCNVQSPVCDSSNHVSLSSSIEYTISCINVSFRHYTTNPFSYQSYQPHRLSDNPWETNLAFILQNLQSCFNGFIYNNFSNGHWKDTSVILKIDPYQDDYYAIGIRNSFGMTVDPLTGNLWIGDNGDDKYDEINLVLEKSNLGATKYVGSVNKESVSTVPGYEEYVYKNPEFVWELPIGITALEFVDSDVFKKYKNWLFVADVHNGNIYKFMLNSDRTGFVFNAPHLLDNIVNILSKPQDIVTPEDIRNADYSSFLVEPMDEILFGKNFGIISDITFGPDGSLYVISYLDGIIYKISS